MGVRDASVLVDLIVWAAEKINAVPAEDINQWMAQQLAENVVELDKLMRGGQCSIPSRWRQEGNE